MVLIVGDAMLVAAALIATSPWTSGLYTWVVQQGLASEVAPARPVRPAEARSAEATRDPAWDGWERQDSSDWRDASAGEALGRLRIAKIGLDATVVKGARETDLRKGPGWVPAASPPGPSGNCGIAGHRTTYLAPFRDLDLLGAGDAVVLETRWRRYTYKVTQRFFVERDDVDVLFPTRDPTLTLTSCHPPYSDRFRIVVQARLARVERR
ncbi:MAG TPA: class E sortase [Coriobacteriia bacterium]|jgi:sortase A